MAEINNQASVKYTYAGARAPVDIDSNITTTRVVPSTSLKVTKFPLGNTYIPGDNHTFIIRVENTGSTPIECITLTDNLGEVVNDNQILSLMNYIPGTGATSKNGEVWTNYDLSSIDPLVISIGTMNAGDVFMFAYSAKTIDGTTHSSISNTATASGTFNGDTVTASDTSTITRASFARVNIQKFSSTASAVVGEDFSYSLVLTNNGNLPATGISIGDNLPENFSLESVSLNDGTTTKILDPSDYSFNNGLLTIPSNSSSLKLTIPPKTGSADGRLSLLLVGRFTSTI